MTFLQYITQKSGFGHTGWPVAVLIHLFMVVPVFAGPWGFLFYMPPALLWYGTWMNYKGYWI